MERNSHIVETELKNELCVVLWRVNIYVILLTLGMQPEALIHNASCTRVAVQDLALFVFPVACH